ncbi:transcription activator effector binding protein [Pseudopedobacter saltans DSM 12145]|uniref:Transcription activator effector binding protein n=1 Tax=Pseudopedobacter saltans (strain ATCC 51119 / DSM 12145 / JCM 21818 / CCUG 39354 / LMG 10337 / NBRC 100064 / NCIMB 13643) TaxID=762903 RepID=F0S4M8_PSESL|nr:GyrI-like domain-containing protein [Pseudopedobacter saltans]ADY52019.1 transcription activator effector binding protein [Pseudopedobacter saltans DSM 12145]
MKPSIIEIEEKRLIGISMEMSFENYCVVELWKQFMPRKNEIANRVSNDLISATYYKEHHFKDFNIQNIFEKCAAVEVSDLEQIPAGMESFILNGGLYAVFHYKGLNTNDSIYRYIYFDWIPKSGYELDHRPHFEILGSKYKNNDTDSEEEIWIPVKPKL